MVSRHAQTRVQQRGIPAFLIDWLLDFGAVESDHRGGEVHYFDRKSKRFAMNLMRRNGLTQLERCLDAYLISSVDGTVITVGHRTKRINRS